MMKSTVVDSATGKSKDSRYDKHFGVFLHEMKAHTCRLHIETQRRT